MSLTTVQNGMLTSDPSNASNLSSGTVAAARLPAGSVLQVQQTVVSTQVSTTNNSGNQANFMSVSITPSSSSNKILVTVNAFIGGAQTANQYCGLYRNTSTAIIAYYDVIRIGQDAQAEYMCVPVAWTYLDSPATTSATTYNFKVGTNYQTVYMNRPYNQGGFTEILTSTITATEIKG